jgi:D-alanyl-lipoteichoic acid acyltransferase DltB (MBOAT superfamily)
MVFASQAFLAFLSVVLGVYWLLGLRHERAGKAWIIAASLFFYGYWVPVYLFLLVGSIVANFTVVRALIAGRNARLRAIVVTIGIAFNIGLIAYYKYFAFLIESLNIVAAIDMSVPEIVLPIGISFFTFQQTGMLVDAWKGRLTKLPFWNHVFLVSFFPHLIAGPIVAQHEMLPQLAAARRWILHPGRLAVGAALFAIGLFKKTVLIDPFAPHIDAIYATAARGDPIGLLDGWAAGVGYGFQVYFDFSGYSDMALGLAFMFGIRLPLNFFSPYKAASIRSFWRRWHVTLSRFLRDLLFIPLGGSRHGLARTIAALLVTMGLGGLWHGAGWNFVIWGLLHGAYLTVNHLWIQLALPRAGRLVDRVRVSPFLSRLALATSVLLTFSAVSFAWVFFRAPDFDTALRLAGAMLGLSGESAAEPVSSGILPMLLPYFLIVWCLPNTMQLFARSGAMLHVEDYATAQEPVALVHRFAFQPSRAWAVGSALIFVIAWFAMSNLSPFIYYQF